MVSKVLRRMEVLRGFIQIPTESKFELIGNMQLPCSTLLNGNPARIDKRGRLWSSYLKNRFSIGTTIGLNKTQNGYQIAIYESEQESPAAEMRQNEKTILVSPSSGGKNDAYSSVLEGDCLKHLNDGSISNIHLTFFDPPYRQGKEYRFFDDNQPEEKYWSWIKRIFLKIYDATVDGGALYFMQREKNAEQVLKVLRETGWTFQNLIVWKKKTSAVPCGLKFSKQYQIIVFVSKGSKPRVFNKLRIDLPPLPEHKYERENGVYLTDVWDDIRELTSGYFAGDEAIRDSKRNRVHTQQSPVALLLRIILSSTLPGDTVFDPLAGTGTTLVVAKQLERNAIGIEIDPEYVKIIKRRLSFLKPSDSISKYYEYYRFTPNLREIWQLRYPVAEQRRLLSERIS